MAKTGTTAASGVTGKAARQPTSKARPSAMPVAQSAAGGVNLGADFGAANLAAMAQANSALIEGFGAIGEAVYAYARNSFASATSTARSMIEARSLADVVALNGEFAQTALEGLVANSARVSEISIRATGEVLKPIGERVADTMAKLSRPKANDSLKADASK